MAELPRTRRRPGAVGHREWRQLGRAALSARKPHASLTGTVVRGVSLSGFGFLLARGVTLVTYVVLARLITPEELGDFAAGTIVVGFGMLLSQGGMPAAIIQREGQLEQAAATAVVATVAAGLASGLITLAASPLIGVFFDSDTAAAVAAATAGVFVIRAGRTVPNALLQRRFSLLRRLIVEPVSAIAFGVGAILGTANGMGVWGLVVGMYSGAVVDLALTWALSGWRPQWRLASFAMWREMVGYARHVLAGSAVQRVGGQVPIALIGGFVGTAALGQYQYANRLVATAYTFLIAGVNYTIFPAFARLAAERARFEQAFLRSLRWMAIVAMPVGFMLLAVGKPLAVLIFGATWTEAGEAAMALCVYIPARAVAAVVGEAFKASDIPGERTKVNTFLLVATVAGMAALLPLGLVGVAAGVSAGSVAGAVYALLRARNRLGISVGSMMIRVWPALAAAGAMATVVLPIELLLLDAASHGTAAGLAILALEVIVGSLVYAGALRILLPDVGRELSRLVRAGRASGPRPAEAPGDADDQATAPR